MERYDRSFFKSYNQGDQSEATIHPSIDFIKKTISKLVTILSKDTRQITERGKAASESKRIINVPEDIVDVIRKVEYFKEAIKNTEVPTIEELKARLEDLERDMPCVSEFDEPVATRLGFRVDADFDHAWYFQEKCHTR